METVDHLDADRGARPGDLVILVQHREPRTHSYALVRPGEQRLHLHAMVELNALDAGLEGVRPTGHVAEDLPHVARRGVHGDFAAGVDGRR
jgi:hypothetical protein